MGVDFSSSSNGLKWIADTEDHSLPCISQSILLCQVTPCDSVSNLINTLRDKNVFSHFESDSDNFKAWLKPISFEDSLQIQTTIELVHNCSGWQDIAEALAKQKESSFAVCFVQNETTDAVNFTTEMMTNIPT